MDRLDCSVCNGEKTRRSYGYEFDEIQTPYTVARIFYLYHCTNCGDNTRVDIGLDGICPEQHIETNWSYFKWNTE